MTQIQSYFMIFPNETVMKLVREWAMALNPEDEWDQGRGNVLDMVVQTLYPQINWNEVENDMHGAFIPCGGYSEKYWQELEMSMDRWTSSYITQESKDESREGGLQT